MSVEDDSIFLEEPFLIDSGELKNPICNFWYSAYCKIEDDSSHIYFSSKDFNPVSWSGPNALDTTGNNINLSFFDENIAGNTLIWEKDSSILCCYDNEISTLTIEGFENARMYQPSSVFYSFISDMDPPGFVSFLSNIEGNQDIYVYWMQGNWIYKSDE